MSDEVTGGRVRVCVTPHDLTTSKKPKQLPIATSSLSQTTSLLEIPCLHWFQSPCISPPFAINILPHTLTEPIHSRLGCELWELTAEGGRKSFFVHKDLLTSQSALLRSKVDASTNERKLDLQSWDAETVGHFVNFLYLHTYGTVKPEPLSEDGDTASDGTTTESRVHTPDTVRSDDTIQPEASAEQSEARPLTPLLKLWDPSEPVENEGAHHRTTTRDEESDYFFNFHPDTHHYQETLLAHARVYSLAQSLAVDALCSMAYNRLLSILGNFAPVVPGSRVAVEIVELLRYVYQNTRGAADVMRKLVSQFAALNFTAVQRTVEIEGLLIADGRVAAGMMHKVCRRLVASEDERDRYRDMAANLEHVVQKLRVENENCLALKGRNATLETALKDLKLTGKKQQEMLSEMTRKFAVSEKEKDTYKKEAEKARADLRKPVKAAASAAGPSFIFTVPRAV